jgi:hypothetical protein
LQGFLQAGGRLQRQRFHQCRFAAVGAGQQQCLGPALARGQRQGDRPAHGPQLTAQAQLTGAPDAIEQRRIQLAAGRQHSQGDRQIQGGPFLAQIRRGEVHDHPRQRHAQPAVADRCPHPLACLLNSRIRQTHHLQPRQSRSDVHLHGHAAGLQAHQGRSAASCQHQPTRNLWW